MPDGMNIGPAAPELEAWIREQAKRPMTREEMQEQRVSLVVGMMPRSSTWSTTQVADFVNSRYGIIQ